MQGPDKVHLGDVYVSRAVQFEIGSDLNSYREMLARHQCGDWGDISPDDILANENALVAGKDVRSSYMAENGVRVWIVSELGRHITTILIPQECHRR